MQNEQASPGFVSIATLTLDMCDVWAGTLERVALVAILEFLCVQLVVTGPLDLASLAVHLVGCGLEVNNTLIHPADLVFPEEDSSFSVALLLWIQFLTVTLLFNLSLPLLQRELLLQ